MKIKILFFGLLSLLFSSCKKNDEIINYQKFNDRVWERFEILKFDIPVPEEGRSWDIYFFANYTKNYEFDNLKFNMIMSTPSGEERIKEYEFMIKDKTGKFLGTCTSDSCSASIALKKGLVISGKGNLRIEIESLVPRLEIRGLLGAGIRMVPAGK